MVTAISSSSGMSIDTVHTPSPIRRCVYVIVRTLDTDIGKLVKVITTSDKTDEEIFALAVAGGNYRASHIVTQLTGCDWIL